MVPLTTNFRNPVPGGPKFKGSSPKQPGNSRAHATGILRGAPSRQKSLGNYRPIRGKDFKPAGSSHSSIKTAQIFTMCRSGKLQLQNRGPVVGNTHLFIPKFRKNKFWCHHKRTTFSASAATLNGPISAS